MDSSSLDILYIYMYIHRCLCPSLFNISSHESSFLLEYNASTYVRAVYTRYILRSALKVAAIPIEEEGGEWGRATF